MIRFQIKKILILFLCILHVHFAFNQPVPQSYYQDLKYRMIGPFRAGRTVGAVGIPDKPNVFFIGVNNGGVWKTDDFGRTWSPIFDSASTGSIGDLAVSHSNNNIIYVGTGEGLHRPDLSIGDGMFKSIDGGKSWKHIGLEDVQQISRVIIHPKNPDIVFVAGMGHPYGPNEERGIFKTINGGISWQKVLYINQNTCAMQVEMDPVNPNILYADMWEHREGPWENAAWSGKNSGLYKSTDGGKSWKPLTKGLPGVNEGLGRIGFCISNSNPKLLFATVDANTNGGIYSSKDAGESWTMVSNERRLWGRGSDFAEIKIHPKNPDKLYVANTASYSSDDGGKTWTGLKGAPGGDDYHRIWINPINPDIMLFAADQGATITVNAGRTWSSWYNQPTAQLYHVSTDNQFPYYVYGGQQESGAIGIASRGEGGQITFRDWKGVGSDEYAYVAADPLNPDIIYGGKLIRYDRRTGLGQNIAPEALRSGNYRMLRTMPLLFHPADPKSLLFATNVLWRTRNGGQSWDIISPDLTRSKYDVPESIGDFRTEEMKNMPRRGVIYSVSASPLHAGTIWAGTDDGLLHITTDGGANWKEITPKALRSWDKISQLDAGHFNVQTAYASVNALRKDDLKPHIYKTNDGGNTWKEIINGIPNRNPINVVREDPKQPGLLFAGSETQVFFSIDDGENWQSLRSNMPATSIRDLVIKDDDLVIGTHGRSIWIMDNISSLREMAAALKTTNAYLFKPAAAIRVRDNILHETPLPPEEPAGQNPPNGATIDYFLKSNTNSVTIEIKTADNQLVRKYTDKDPEDKVNFGEAAYPSYWMKPAIKVSTATGQHRIVWDLKYTPPAGTERELSIAAVYKNTPPGPDGPYVHPGIYRVILTVDNVSIEKQIEVVLDPRVQISEKDLTLQTDLSMECYKYYHEAQAMRDEIDNLLKTSITDEKKKSLTALRGSGLPSSPDQLYGSITASTADKETIVGLQNKWLHIMNFIQSADSAPTMQTREAIKKLKGIWMEMKKRM